MTAPQKDHLYEFFPTLRQQSWLAACLHGLRLQLLRKPLATLDFLDRSKSDRLLGWIPPLALKLASRIGLEVLRLIPLSDPADQGMVRTVWEED